MRSVAALTALSCLLLAGCGGSDSEPSTEPGAGETLEELWRAPGDDVAVIPGTENYEPGDVRVSFLVVDAEGALVALPTARVWVADGLESAPFLETEAKLERIGIPGGDEADATHIYVATLRLPRPGKYWFLAEPDGGARRCRLSGTSSWPRRTRHLMSATPPSRHRRRRLRRPEATRLRSRREHRRTRLSFDIRSPIRSPHNVPFVVTFSTPKFCSSRTCGPVVDVVEEVSRRFEDDGIRFIHVEVFEDNDPAKGFNRWMQEWKLPTEPWTFLVGADGKIAARFEGTVSVSELEQAVREKLAAAS